MKDDEKRKLKSRITTVTLIVILIVLITPVRKAKIHESASDDHSIKLPETNRQELEQVREFLDYLRNKNYFLVRDNYPNSLTFRWAGATFETSPKAKADEIALQLYNRSGRSVRIILEVGEEKYSGLYRPE